MLDSIDPQNGYFSVFATEIPNLLPTTSAVISTIRQAEVLPDVEAITLVERPMLLTTALVRLGRPRHSMTSLISFHLAEILIKG